MRLGLPQLLEKLDPIHPRHGDVEQDGIVVVLTGQRESFVGFDGGVDLIALAGKDTLTSAADHFFIVNHKKGWIGYHDMDSHRCKDC